ncbi:MAG: hypothetical protein U0935_20860 [Pirellulales bacterium]
MTTLTMKSPHHENANILLDYAGLRLVPRTIHVVFKASKTPRWFGLGCRASDEALGKCSPELTLDRLLQMAQLSVGCQRRRLGRFDCVVAVPESQLSDDDPRTALTRDFVFFEEAIARATHPRYARRRQATRQDEAPQAISYGRRIIRQFKQALRQFAQNKTSEHDIVRLFSRLLARVAGQRHVPATFTTGKALPSGLAEVLIDLVVRAKESAVPSLDGIQWEGDWQAACSAAPEEFSKELRMLLAAYRDALLNTGRRQYCQSYSTRAGRERIDVLAEKLVAAEGAAERARKLRAARATAQRIYSNPTLQGLMLQDVLDALYRLPEVTQHGGADADNLVARDRAVFELVSGARVSDRVAPPVKRLSSAEKRAFRQELFQGFEKFIEAVLAESASSAATLEQRLSPQLRELVAETRRSPAKVGLLRQVAGANPKAFVASARDLIAGVLLPVLLRDPTQSVADWLDAWRETVERLYLTALLLDQNSLTAIRGIAKEQDIVRLMDELVVQNGDKEALKSEVIGRIVAGLVDVYAQPELQRRLLEGLATLKRIATLAREVELPLMGLAHLPAQQAVAEQTRVRVREVVKQKLTQKVEQRIAVLRNAPGPAAETPSDSAENAAAVTTGAAENPSERTSEVDREIDEILGGLMASTPATEKFDYDQLAAQTMTALTDSVARHLVAFSQCLHLIYARYEERQDVLPYKTGVEVLALHQLMLEDKHDLPFGQSDSALFPLLSGLVEHASDDADLDEFIRQVPLTRFFEEEKLSDDGVVNLRLTLEQQGLQSLQALTASFAELHALELIIDHARACGGRVIVFDATADEYLQILRDDAQGSGLFGPGSLVQRDGAPPSLAGGITVLLGSAFREKSREDFLQGLERFELVSQGYPLWVPPLVLSTGLGAAESASGAPYAEQLAERADRAALAVTVVGPDLPLNPPGDALPSQLDAAAVFGAGVLAGGLGLNAPRARLAQGIPGCSSGRHLIVGAGTASLDQSIRAGVVPANAASQYAFSVDQMLQMIALGAAAGKYHGGDTRFNETAYLDSFHWAGSGMVGRFQESDWLREIFPGLQVALEQRPSQSEVTTVLFHHGPRTLTDRRVSPMRLGHVAWFSKSLQALGLAAQPVAEEATAE